MMSAHPFTHQLVRSALGCDLFSSLRSELLSLTSCDGCLRAARANALSNRSLNLLGTLGLNLSFLLLLHLTATGKRGEKLLNTACLLNLLLEVSSECRVGRAGTLALDDRGWQGVKRLEVVSKVLDDFSWCVVLIHVSLVVVLLLYQSFLIVFKLYVLLKELSSIIDVVVLIGQREDCVVDNRTLKLLERWLLLISPILGVNSIHPELHGFDGLLLQFKLYVVLIFHTISIRDLEGTFKLIPLQASL